MPMQKTILAALIAALSAASCATPKKKDNIKVTDDRDTPVVTKPEIQCVQVPDKIEDGGKTYIKRHDVCTIKRGSEWTME